MAEIPQAFRDELADAQLAFTMPNGFDIVAPRSNDRVAYTCAIAAQRAKLEVRYHIVSLKPRPMPPGYTRVASADPNTLFVPNLFAIMQSIASQVLAEPQHLAKDALKREVGADDGATCRVQLAPSTFSDGFAQCFLFAIHRNDTADAYVMFLADDFDAVDEQFGKSFYSLRFR